VKIHHTKTWNQLLVVLIKPKPKHFVRIKKIDNFILINLKTKTMNIKKLITILLIGFISFSNVQAQDLQFCLQSKKGDKFLSESIKTYRNNGRSSTYINAVLNPRKAINQMTKFRLYPVAGEQGYYYIRKLMTVNGQREMRYLCPTTISGDSKITVGLFTNNSRSNDAFKWRFKLVRNGYYNIINKKKGNYLDVKWGNTANQTPIWLWPKNGDDAQLWRIIPVRNNTLRTRPVLLAAVLPGNSSRNTNSSNRTTTNSVITNPKVKVTILNCKATHGDDGGSDRTFEFYTKIRVAKGRSWRASSIPAYHYPKWNSSMFRAQPSGTNNRFKSYSYDKSLYGVDGGTGYFKVYISLWDYDEASGDDHFDINPERGANEIGLIVHQPSGKIYYGNGNDWINIGKKGMPFTIEGTDYNNNDELTAKMTLKIDWR